MCHSSYYNYYYPRLTTSMSMPVPECQTILKFNGARDAGSVNGANQNSKTCKAPVR